MRIFDPTIDKQLSASVATLMHEGVKVLLPQGGESTLAKVSPVPLKIAKKISLDDYVEMEKLLPEVGTLEDDVPEPKYHCTRQLFDTFAWLQYFVVYNSICRVQSLDWK